LHLLEYVGFSSTWNGSAYPLVSFGDRDDRVIDLPLLPGVYDVVFRRWSSSSESLITNHEQDDPYGFGNRILAADVVVGPGVTTLDVEIAPARVTGAITFAGAPPTLGSQSSADIGIYLRAHDTGALHLLEYVGFSSTWNGSAYPLVSFGDRDDRIIDLPLLPGVYDVVFRRWSSSDESLITNHEQDDPYGFGNRVLAQCLVVD
jgi:hypothetical protein